MAKPYSQDLRERVVGAVDAGHRQAAVATMFNLGRRTVVNYLKRWRETGGVAPDKFGGHKKHKLAAHADKVKALLQAAPDQTLAELQAKLAAAQIKVGRSSVDRFLRASGLTYKKTLCAAEQQRQEVAEARAQWRERQPTLDPAKLVFIDETWTSTAMTRRYGRALKGERLLGYAPGGHWKTTTFIAALRHNALTAPAVFDGPLDGESFRAYIQQILVPTLNPGDQVIMDNLSVHKVDGVRQALEAVGATRVLLPSYSPDLNPIEQVFAKLKARLRKVAKRSIPTLWHAIGQALALFSSAECLNYFRHSGYAHT